jgi:hypothetical protein
MSTNVQETDLDKYCRATLDDLSKFNGAGSSPSNAYNHANTMRVLRKMITYMLEAGQWPPKPPPENRDEFTEKFKSYTEWYAKRLDLDLPGYITVQQQWKYQALYALLCDYKARYSKESSCSKKPGNPPPPEKAFRSINNPCP